MSFSSIEPGSPLDDFHQAAAAARGEDTDMTWPQWARAMLRLLRPSAWRRP